MNPGRALSVWPHVIAAESASGTMRERWIAPTVGELPAHRLGVVLGTVLIFLISRLTAPWLGARTTKSARTCLVLPDPGRRECFATETGR